MFEDKAQIEEILSALASQLEAEGVRSLELVVCGGTALSAIGAVTRMTQDVDIVAIIRKGKGGVKEAEISSSLDQAIIKAARRVQKDFNLSEDWLNARTASLFGFGLPKGLLDRAIQKKYGGLTIHFISRYDQIHFKLFAGLHSEERRAVHLSDLLALDPAKDELKDAARWIMTRESGEMYKHALKKLLGEIGFKDAAEEL